MDSRSFPFLLYRLTADKNDFIKARTERIGEYM